MVCRFLPQTLHRHLWRKEDSSFLRILCKLWLLYFVKSSSEINFLSYVNYSPIYCPGVKLNLALGTHLIFANDSMPLHINLMTSGFKKHSCQEAVMYMQEKFEHGR